MAFKNSTNPASPISWSVAELGAFYTNNRTQLLAHANRILKDNAKAEEITQDALIKFMLAAPEIESADHALAYLHRTIENLCIDLFRMEGRRPNLVLLDESTAEVEASWSLAGDHSSQLTAAEDAAIIRQALAMLSPAERAALVLWEIEGRSTQEIAAELGIKESAVRHTVSRARASLRRVLTEIIVDEERGLTALDLLSTTYKKAAKIAKKSSKVALSLILVISAFLGLNSLTGNENSTPLNLATSERSTSPKTPQDLPAIEVVPALSLDSELEVINKMLVATTEGVNFLRVAIAGTGWNGLDVSGAPVGFTNNSGAYTSAKRSEIISIVDGDTVFVSEQNGLTLYLTQSISQVNGKSAVQLLPIFSLNGKTYEPAVTGFSTVILPSGNGGQLINGFITLAGTDAQGMVPTQLNVRIALSNEGLILSESAQLIYSPTNEASI